MVKPVGYATVFALLAVAASAWADNEAPPACAELRCDCLALPFTALQAACSAREAKLQAHCTQHGIEATDYCSYYGEQANRGSLSLFDALSENTPNQSIGLLKVKWGALRTALTNNLKRFADSTTRQVAPAVNADLQQIQGTADDLLQLQTQLAEQLAKTAGTGQVSGTPDASAQSWRQFSSLMEDTAMSLQLARETLGAKAPEISTAIMVVEAGLYEHAGYGIGLAGDYAQAAQLWKTSADRATELMALARRSNDAKIADEYRYQRSTRLHRARENWGKLETRN